MASRIPPRLHRMFGRMGVRLWVPFVIGAFVSVAVVALLVIVSVDAQRQRTFAEQRDIANNLALQTSSYLAKLQNNLQTVAHIVPLAPADRSAVERLLSNVQQSEPAYMELAVVGANGIDVARVTRPDVPNTGLQNRAADSSFQTAMTGETYLGEVKPVNGFPTMRLTLPIASENGTVGVVTAQIDLTTLWELVSTASAHGYTYIVDDHGSLIAYRDLAAAPPNAMNQPVVLEAVTSNAESAASQTYDTGLAASGEPVLAYYKPLSVGNGKWYAIVEEPTSEAFAQVNNFFVAGALLLIASVLAIILMGLYISRRVVRPISILRHGAAQLAAGNFDQRIGGVNTGDELEFLAVEFNDMAARLQSAQAAMMETASEREQQYQVAQRRVKEMSTLLEAGRAITSLDLENVLDNLARESAGTVGANRCAIYVLDEAQNLLTLRGWWDFEGLVRPELQYPLGEGVVGWAARENKVLFLANAQADQRFIARWEHDNDIAAVMNVPLTSAGVVVGVLQVATRPGTPAFSREDQRLLNRYAEQSAVAIKNAQLYEIERRRAQEMALVAEINRTISKSLDLDTTLNAILASIRALIPYDLAEINLWDEKDKLLRTRGRGAAEQYEAHRYSSRGVYGLDDGISGWLARKRTSLLIADTAASEVKAILDQQQFPVRAVCAAPLMSGDQLVGTIELASFTPQAFAESHLETLTTIAAQAAVAIQNAQLFAETRRRVDESATLFRMSVIAASALPPDELLRKLMTEIGTLLNAELGLAMLYNANSRRLEPLFAASFGDLPGSARDFRIDAASTAFQYSVFSTRTVFHSDDALNDPPMAPFYREFVDRYQVRSLMVAPLIIRDHVIGEVYVAKRTVAPFAVEDEQRLSTVLTLLADAIENSRLSAEQQRRLNQLSLLGEIGRAISTALREEDVYGMLYEQINQLLDAPSLYIATYDAASDEVEFRRLYEEGELVLLPDEERIRRSDNSLTFYVCRSRTRLLLRSDVAAEAAKLGITVRQVASGRPAQAWMGAPMIAGDRVVGMLAVQNLHDSYAYDENDLNLLQAIANQTGITVENARRYQVTDVRLNERVEELMALSAIGQELNATLDRERIFKVVLTEALKVTGAAYGFISMIEPQSRMLEVRATQGLTPREASLVAAKPIHVGEGITGRAALTEQTVLVKDVRLSADYIDLRPGTLSEIAVPVCYAQSVVGVLNLEGTQVDAFTEEHANFLNALAAQAAIAIGNAQRLEEYKARGELLRRRAEQLTNLFQIGQAFSTDQPLEHLLDDVVHAIQESVGFDIAVLNLLDGEPASFRCVAAAGVPIAVFEEMKKSRQPWALFEGVLQEQFRISQSYYVPMEQVQVIAALETFYAPGVDPSVPRRPGFWHPDDFMVTLLRGAGDRVLGFVSVDQPTDGLIPPRATIETLELFANQAAIAIENHALYDGLQQRLSNLTLFNEVGRSISTQLDLDSLLTTVLDAAGKLVDADFATIFLPDPQDGKFVPRKALGYRLEQISHWRFGPDEGQVGMIVGDPRAIVIPNVDQEPRYVRHAGSGDVQSVILAPLSVAGSLIGVLTAEKPVRNGFTDTDRVILATLADQAAVAIDNARLFDAEREQRSLAETLRDLSTALSRTLNVNEVLDMMLAQVARVVPHDAANIMMIEEPGSIARVTRSRGYDRISPGLSETLMSLRFAVRDVDNLRQIVETGQPMIIADTRTYVGWIDTPQTRWVRSYLCAPLRIRDNVVGFFNLDSARPDSFTSVHAERLLAFAAQSSVAIENARLYEETQRRLEDQSLLYEAGQAISATLAYDQVLETVADQLVRATRAQVVLIQEWDRTRDQVATVFQKYGTMEGLRDPVLLERPFAPTEYLKVAHYLRDRRSISLRVQDDDLDPLLRARMQNIGLLWTVEVPIVARDEVLGLVRLGDTRFDRTLSDSEVQVIETLVNQAAVAMSNARLYEQVVKFTQELEGHVAERTRELAVANAELTQERDRVETLFRISSELSTSLDLDRVLTRALELVVTAAGAAHGSILLVDPRTDVLVARAVLGGDKIPASGKPTPFRRGEGLAGWAIMNRQSAIVDDVHDDSRWIEHSSQIRQFRSGLVVPLSVSDDVLGAMLLLHHEPHYFNEVHMRLVSAASSQVATAINNAELYHYIREQAELLGSMLRAQQVESSKSQAILESVADGVMVSDDHGRVILFNAAAERILGIQRNEALNRPIDDMLGLYAAAGPRWVAQVREWHASAEARRRMPVLSQRMEFKAEKRFVTVTVAPVTMSDEYLGSVSVFRDVTAEVEADRAKSEFVSTVSHELRTPMTSIKGYADLLLIGAAGPVNENQQRFLSVIKSNADRLSILVNDLLDISRIESGRVKLDLKPLSVEPAIEAVLTLLRARIDERNLTLRVQLPDTDLPRVYGDRDRLTQILTNLISNAYQYTPAGGTITIRAHAIGGLVQIDVSDTGIGIAPENQAKVFDRFFRADDPLVQEFSGTGLGLSIVKSLVEMHEGRIWLESQPGVGTTFSFTLRAVELPETVPVEQPSPATAGPVRVAPVIEAAPAADGRRPAGRRVLVVEDDRDIAELIGQHLAGSGYRVSIAGCAKDALLHARELQPDLITLDIYLPDADGFELLQQLKTDPATSTIPVVIVSVMSDQQEGLRLGAVDYLTKPIDPQRLVATVNRVLHGPGKVLVVDDDRDTRALLQVALEQRGFVVVQTASGKRALTLARQEQPNLILLDLRLPNLDGHEVLQRLKSMPETADIPVVIITGSLTDEELKRQNLLSLGATRFLTKPFAVDELVKEISLLVEKGAVEPVL